MTKRIHVVWIKGRHYDSWGKKNEPSSFTIPSHVELSAFAKDRLGFEFYHFFFSIYILVIRLFLLTPFFSSKKEEDYFFLTLKIVGFKLIIYLIC